MRYDSHLSDRVRELSILLVAASWRSSFERDAHEAVGRGCGLTEDEMTAVAGSTLPLLSDPVEHASLRLVEALLAGDIDDATWSVCVPPLTVRDVFELVTLVGYYSTLALQMRVLRIGEPDA